MMQILTLVFWLAMGAAQQTASGSVGGTVLRTGTTEPIEGVQVTLTLGASPPVSVLTDKEGHFSFRNAASGRYTIRFQRDGYLVPGSTPFVATTNTVSVGADEQVNGLTYYLTPGGTISGRILDPLGRPSVGADVIALRPAFEEGRAIFVAVKTASSNDRGEYRMFWLEPGDYYVRAEKTLTAGPARAYYPGTDSANRAVKVHLAAGEESSKIDILLQSDRMMKISGTVVNTANDGPTLPSSATPAAPQFYLLPADSDFIFEGAQNAQNALTSAQDRAAGKFELRNVRPGSYDLFAVVTDTASSPARSYLGRTLIEVGFQDLSGVTVEVVAGRDLTGRVIFPGAVPLPVSLRVQLRPKGLLLNLPPTRSLSAVVAEDGTFTIPNVPDFEYAVSAAPLPPNAYIADIRQGGFSIFDIGTIRVGGRSSQGFEVVVDSPGAAINGSVPASPQQLAAGIAVALIPDERRRENRVLYKRTTVSAAGAFSFSGVAPGRYTLFAWESIPGGAEFNTEFMDAFRDEGREVTVTPGDTSTVQLRLILK